MLRPYRDLLIVIVLAASLVWATNFFGIENVWLRSLLALPFLLGTGYLVGTAIFPGNQLDGWERFLLSLGLSLSTLVLTGLVLHFTPSGLRVEAWTGMLFLIGAVAAGIAYFRREIPHHTQLMRFPGRYRNPGLPGDEGDTVAARVSRPIRGNKSSAYRANSRLANVLLVLTVSLSVLIVVLSAGMTFMPAPQSPFQGYSMLWMAPSRSSETNQVELGLRSMEFNPQTYRIDLYLGNQIVQQWDAIQLAPQEEWTTLLNMDEYGSGNQHLEARLYLGVQTEQPYRLARLSLQTALDNASTGN